MDSSSSFNHKKKKRRSNLEEARKKLSSIQGPSIAFKRSKQGTTTTRTDEDSSSSNGEEKSAPVTKNEDVDFISSIISPYVACTNVSARYKKESRIGKGTYGIVYKALDTATKGPNNNVALKRCLPHHEASDGFPITTLREIQILREVGNGSHENIVELKEVAVSSKQSGVFLVFEYLHFDLAMLIDEHYAKCHKSPFTIAETKCLAQQLFAALDYLQDRFIVHRDLKLSNLLYDRERGLLKLADFGLARRIGRGKGDEENSTSSSLTTSSSSSISLPTSSSTIPQHLTPKVVSLWSRPPELCLGSEQYDISIDQWGAACVVSEFILGIPLLKGNNEFDQFQKIMDLLGKPNVRIWPDLMNMPLIQDGSLNLNHHQSSCHKRGCSLMDRFGETLSTTGIQMLSNLFQYDPGARLTAKEVRESEWFREKPLPTIKEFMPRFETRKSFGK